MCKKWFAVMVFSWIAVAIPVQSAIPPKPREIVNTINALWQQEKFDEIDTYVASLMAHHGSYLPARTVEAVQSYQRGAQSEDLVHKLNIILKDIKNHAAEISPACREGVESIIFQHLKFLEYHTESGYSKEQRLKKASPKNIPRHRRAKSWSYMFDFFLEVCPPVSLPGDPSAPVIRYHAAQPSARILALGIPELKQKIMDKKSGIAERTAAVNVLNKKAGREDIAYLIKCISYYHYKIATACAVAVSGNEQHKQVVISMLLKTVADKRNAYLTNWQNVLWTLIRISKTSPGILPALEKSSKDNNLHRIYTDMIKETVEYLRNK